jgi:4-hydroxythreonine-4-phosphate dehydrogenase
MGLSQGEHRPKLVITLGDPAGIGPEVVLKALGDPAILAGAAIGLCGDRELWHEAYKALIPRTDGANPGDFEIVDAGFEGRVTLGVGSAASGEAGFRAIDRAIDRTLAGDFEGIVTAPISKAGWKAAGHLYPGQTELLSEKAGCDRFGMLFVGRSPHTGWILRALLATVHIPLSQVPMALTPEVMTRKLTLLLETLAQDFGIMTPTVTIAGLNPHSGELGQLGREECEWLMPWLEGARLAFPQATLEGLLPPDTMWVKPGQAWFGTAQVMTADAYLALYHDQGLIPVKLMAFDRAVNTSIGLPFVRTSPDHGTAFDIAGQGIADPTSMKEAILWATELCHTRRAFRISQSVMNKL